MNNTIPKNLNPSILDLAIEYPSKPKESTSKPPSAIASYKLYGVTRNQVASMMLNLFHYPSEYRDTLQSYYILHWDAGYLDSQMTDGMIRHSDVDYLVVYQGCTPYAARRAKQLKLSLRQAKVEFNLQAYVIIRIVQEG
jgi:hypothetical protein